MLTGSLRLTQTQTNTKHTNTHLKSNSLLFFISRSFTFTIFELLIKSFNSLLHDKILHLSPLKAFAHDILFLSQRHYFHYGFLGKFPEALKEYCAAQEKKTEKNGNEHWLPRHN